MIMGKTLIMPTVQVRICLLLHLYCTLSITRYSVMSMSVVIVKTTDADVRAPPLWCLTTVTTPSHGRECTWYNLLDRTSISIFE